MLPVRCSRSMASGQFQQHVTHTRDALQTLQAAAAVHTHGADAGLLAALMSS